MLPSQCNTHSLRPTQNRRRTSNSTGHPIRDIIMGSRVISKAVEDAKVEDVAAYVAAATEDAHIAQTSSRCRVGEWDLSHHQTWAEARDHPEPNRSYKTPQTPSRGMQTGMPVSPVGSMWKTDIRPPLAPPSCANTITRSNTRMITRSLMLRMNLSPREGTRRSCPTCDGFVRGGRCFSK
jgi:hypothetical protein